ncbi:hypothetical protein B0A48_01967 [Cryoendolithus antarcticus]|uniref:Uncharacterized protein n=1 Tax=Cryoendolithus antarcticus TaxID=1507870 RepID=A0A1V8TQU6_9PEZI|nr:hypothetical protein B0A48_01967 [Cryoendolithus antarcticus]
MAFKIDGGNAKRTSDSRTFLLLASSLAVFNQALAALACYYLPAEPSLIVRVVASYAVAACLISGLGLLGILRDRPGFLTMFAHFLWIDAVLSFFARLLVLDLLFSTFDGHAFCTDLVQSLWMPEPSLLRSQDPLAGADLWCGVCLSAIQIASIMLVLCMGAAQAAVALAVRQYRYQLTRADCAEQHVEIVLEKV